MKGIGTNQYHRRNNNGIVVIIKDKIDIICLV